MLEIRHDEINEKYTVRDAYNDIYSGEGILHKDSLYIWLINLLRPEPGKKLVDIACGEGRIVKLAQQMGIISTGTDFAIEGIRRGLKSSPFSSWFVADGENLPVQDHVFDYVTHIGSLEHYGDPIQGAKEIARLMKKGGKACILLPNTFGILGNVLYVMRTGDVFDDGQPLQRYATRKAWERILIEAGLTVNEVYGYNGVVWPVTKKDWIWWLQHPVKIVKYFVSKLIPANLSNHIVYICTYHG